MKRLFLKQISLALVLIMLFSLVGVAEDVAGVEMDAISNEVYLDDDLFDLETEVFQDDLSEEELTMDIFLEGETPTSTEEPEESIDFPETTDDPESENVSIPNKLILGVEETYTLKCDNATYKSSKSSVVAVNKKGVVTAKKTGTAKITVKSGGNTVATCKVTVLAAPKKITLNKTELTLPMGSTATLKASLPNKTASNKLTWKSSNKKIVEVDTNGVLTPIKAGKAKVTVTTFNNKKATCIVTVNENVSIPNKLILGVKETYTLKCDNATYKSSKSSVAAVNKKGVVTAKKTGTAKITVKSGGKTVATCKVTVLAAPKKITLNKTELTLPMGSTATLKASLPNKTASNKLTWKSSNKKIVKVDTNGVLTPIKAGKAKVTVTTFNNKRATCIVTVNHDPISVEFATKTISIGLGEAVSVKPVMNEGAKTTFTWSTKNKKIVAIDKNGKMTGKKVGSTKITVKTKNGLSATLTVKVLKKPSKVTLSDTIVEKGGTVQLQAKLPNKTASYTLKWTSSDKKIAEVDAQGVVTGKKPGTATITVTTFNKMKATCTVTVTEPEPTEAPSITSLTIKFGDVVAGQDMIVLYDAAVTASWIAEGDVASYSYVIKNAGEETIASGAGADVTSCTIAVDGVVFGVGEVYTLTVSAIPSNGTENNAFVASAQFMLKLIDKDNPTPAEYFTYEPINGLYAGITGYTGEDSVVVIPQTIDDYTIQEIKEEAFLRNKTIEYVVIPDTVETIGKQAFSRCSALQEVDLGKGLVTLGNWVFYDDSSLKQINFPDSVTTMGKGVLQDCKNLEYVGYPKGWTTADKGGDVFAGCPKLTRIDIPEGVKIIPNYAFANCSNLQEINLPEGLEDIYHHAFSNCTGLTKLVYPSTIKTVGGINGCTGITEISIPKGATTIGTNAFDSVPLTTITIPGSVVEINNFAFNNCTSLNTIVFSDGLETIGLHAFEKCTSLTKLNLPDSVSTIGNYAFANCSSLTEFHYPRNWTTVTREGGFSFDEFGHNFDNDIKLKTVSIPEGVTQIPRGAFAYATYIKSITVPNTIKTIGVEAFKGCTAITNIDWKRGIESIGFAAFEGCTNLASLNLPDTVTSIGCYAFAGCEKLKSFHYPSSWNTVTISDSPYDGKYYLDWGHNFDGCTKLNEINISEGTTYIPTYAFAGAEYVKKVTFPSTLTEIGFAAFNGCVSITEAKLPDSVDTIGCYAFANCTNLITFHFPLNWTTLKKSGSPYHGIYYFDYGHIVENCEKLKNIEIPEGVESIPQYAFYKATGLEELGVPSSLKEIGNNAFDGCENLKKVYLGYNVKTVNEEAFANCPALTIWTEYGATALQYAKDNSINYYYLTPDGINSPSGTLYKGDNYALYGYARSSVNITEITAAVLDNKGSAVIQTITVNPDSTDYNLADTVNASLLFGNLELGNYRYTLKAKTAVSEEVWADQTFTIAPPPLRVSVSGLGDLAGTVGSDYVLKGTVYANYPMSSLTVTLKNMSSDTIYPSFSCSPNSKTYSLSNVSGVSLADKPTGNYQLTITVSGNGETRTPVNAFFSIGKYDGNINSEVFDQLVSFTGNSSNRSIFDKYREGSNFLGSITITDTLLMAINFRSEMCMDIISQQLRGDHLSQFMIKRYKKEIAAIIDDLDVKTNLTSSDSTYNDLIDSMTSNLRITFTLNENDSFVTKRMMNMSRIINYQLDKIENLCKINGWIMDAKDYYRAFMQNYENSMMILEMYSGYNTSNSPELRTAVEELANDYDSKVFKAMNILTNMLVDKMSKELYKDALKLFEAATDLIDKKLTGQYGGYSIMWSAVNFAIDAAMEMNNYDDVADSLMNTVVRVETFGQALDSYHQAFDAVRNGDTTSAALNRLGISYQLCCSSGTRMYDALATTAWWKTNFGENSDYMDKYSELWRMEYDKPFDNWR